MEAFIDNCKEIQSRIESFEHGNLSLKDEEAFTNHILNCADCREEMEIYYIILYGLEDDNEKRTENSRYSAYLDAFDFTGLVEQAVFMRQQVQAAGDHRFRRLLLPKRRQEMWRRS